MTGAEARTRFMSARVARLATVGEDGAPHLVPIVFAVAADPTGTDVIYTAIDAKPKRTTALRRLANIAAEPRVALLADHYAEDWSALWWARADGDASLADDDEARQGLELLTARYPQYREQPPPGPVLAIRVRRWSGWSAIG